MGSIVARQKGVMGRKELTPPELRSWIFGSGH